MVTTQFYNFSYIAKKIKQKNMPFLNFDNRHFSEAEKTTILEALNTLETALQPKLAI